MSQTKQLADKKGRLGPDDLKRRAQAEIAAKTHALGYPTRPQGLPRQARDLWNQIAQKLYELRLLATDDAELLLQLVNAKIAGDDAEVSRMVVLFQERDPFPEPAAEPEPLKPEVTLPDFLASVARERTSFAERMRPDKTVTLDLDGSEYTWRENDPAEVARQYALEVTQGKIVAGELIVRACSRFLKDLEDGAERGLWFDPVAARHICRFAEVFCKLKLMDWQTFCLVNVFGWKRSAGQRRFTEAFISVARKNGKTRLASVVALWLLLCDQEKFPEIYAAATKKEQAKIVWKDARRTVADSEELSAYVKRWAHELATPLNDGSFVPLASEEKSLDGLRVHGAIADELHAWTSREVWDRLIKATVSRTQPLIWGITTAGESRHSFCWSKQDLCEKILRGVYPEDSTFVAIYKLDDKDDHRDTRLWQKANPSLLNPDIMQPEHLRKSLGECEQDPSGLSAFLRFHCNVWPEVNLARAGSIAPAKWDQCGGLDLIGEKDPRRAVVKFLLLNRDVPCFLGVDVGLVNDLTAIVMLWTKARFADGADPISRPVVVVYLYMPETGMMEKAKSWSVPLAQWVREDWIDLTPGDMIDPREIQKEIRELHELFTVREIGYDPWQFAVAAAELCEQGISCVAVQQVPSQLTPAVREFEAAINRGELIHFGNPALAWMAGNVVFAESEKHGGVRPEKIESPTTKIDAIQAIVNAFNRALANPVLSAPRMFFFGDDDKVRVSNTQTGQLDAWSEKGQNQ